MIFRGTHLIAGVMAMFGCAIGQAAATATLQAPDVDKPRIALAKKLLRISGNVNLREARTKDSTQNPQADTNANDGNSFSANTTYHSYVMDYCESWIGPRRCQKFLDPYVSIHGSGGDRSVLEGVVYDEYLAQRNDVDVRASGNGTQRYKIWDVKTNGGALIDGEGRLERRSLTSWALRQDVKKKVQKAGVDLADQLVASSFEPGEAKDGSVLPNMETIRDMASRFTRNIRNRLVSLKGDIDVAQPGIEMMSGEEMPDCNDYATAMQSNPDRFRLEEKIDPQAPLSPQSRKPLEQRISLCQKARNMNIYSVNNQVQGNEVKPTQADNAWVDEWRTRANLVTIDRAGADPNEVDIPRNTQIEKEEFTQDVAVFDKGGRNMRTVAMTNADQMQSYNEQLEGAKRGYKEVSARTSMVPDRSAEIDQWKLEKGSINLVKLNGLTPEMRTELKGVFPRDQVSGGDNDPEENLEDAPTKIIVRQR